MPSRDFLESLGIFLLCLFLFTCGANLHGISGFESRFYVFAVEMWQRGVDWFPTLYGQPYPDYPATSTIFIYVAASVLGRMSRLAAVFPTAIAAAVTMAMTYRIGAIQNKRWGLLATFFLLITFFFLKSAQSVSPDMIVAMVTTCCFYIVYSVDMKVQHKQNKWLYALLLLGFAVRGPIGLILPAGVVSMYYLQSANFRRLFLVGATALLLLILSMMILALIADHTGGPEFLHAVLMAEVAGRLSESHQVLPIYFYFVQGLEDYAPTFPLALMVTLGVMYYEECLHEHTPALRLLLKLFGWMIVILLGMSVLGSKKTRYILSMAPAISLLSAYIFVAPKTERYFLYLRWIVLRAFLLLPIALFIGIQILLLGQYKQLLFSLPIDYVFITKILFALFGCSFAAFIALRDKPTWRESGILFIAATSVFFVYLMVVQPIAQFLNPTQDFVRTVEAIRKGHKEQLVFYDVPQDGWAVKYLAQQQTITSPIFITGEAALAAYSERAYFVTDLPHYNVLSAEDRSLHMVMHGNVETTPVVVFEKATNR